MTIVEWINQILVHKTPWENFDESEHKTFSPFIVNRCLSYFSDTILYVNEVNKNSHLDKKLQYDYLLNSVRKRKRFSKWLMRELPDELDFIKEYYGYSDRKAREVVNMFADSDIEEMTKYLYTGGKK